MQLLDGKKLASKMLEELKERVAASGKQFRLAIVVAGKDPVVERFIEQKRKAAKAVGIDVRVYPFDPAITTNELRRQLAIIVHGEHNTGVVIQLPLPPQINKQYILNAVTPEKDPDVLSARALGSFVAGKHPVLPPVAGAIRMLLDEYHIPYQDKHVVIVGAGNLVGRPAALWLIGRAATVSIITEETQHPEDLLRQADIVITGIGRPGFITGSMLKEGVVVLDAGTSEADGKMVGDADVDSVAEKAAYITPVPGGIGPLTVAILLQNIITLATQS